MELVYKKSLQKRKKAKSWCPLNSEYVKAVCCCCCFCVCVCVCVCVFFWLSTLRLLLLAVTNFSVVVVCCIWQVSILAVFLND